MRVIRGRASSIAEDREVTQALAADVRETDEAAVRVWTPHRQVAFGRRDTRAERYEQARRAAQTHDFEPYERSVGGRAVAYTGTTLAFVRIEPISDLRFGTDERYDRIVRELQGAFSQLSVEMYEGEPDASWCPGAHSLSVENVGKVIGVAQRVAKGAAQVAGIVIIQDHDAIAAVLEPVYDALAVPFSPLSVGSVAAAEGPSDPEQVARVVESALIGDREMQIQQLRSVTHD
jgi:lipoate-protein ligase A